MSFIGGPSPCITIVEGPFGRKHMQGHEMGPILGGMKLDLNLW